jgi:ubiquinone/menaquinone biosynthesis C-methylase UbiE
MLISIFQFGKDKYMSLISETRRYYDAISAVYDETAGYNEPEAEKQRAVIKARYQEILKGRRVLEIACGSGYWTEVIGQTATSVLATDINASILNYAKRKCSYLSNVEFQIADAYSLEGVRGGFDAAFAHWWWSHIPKSYIAVFLTALHRKLEAGAIVLFVDHLPYDAGFTKILDAEGNTLEQRALPDKTKISIVKNFPTRQEVMDSLAGIAYDIRYTEYPNELSWDIFYRRI